MKIYFNKKPISGPWGGGNSFVSEMSSFLSGLGHSVVFSLEEHLDIIFIMDPRKTEEFSFKDILNYKSKNPFVKIIHRINDTDKARPYAPPVRDELFLEVNKHTDYTIFISEWVKKYFSEKGFNTDESSVIINGCSSKFYYPKDNELTSPIKMITHHWSDGPMKGFDVYNFLDTALIGQSV